MLSSPLSFRPAPPWAWRQRGKKIFGGGREGVGEAVGDFNWSTSCGPCWFTAEVEKKRRKNISDTPANHDREKRKSVHQNTTEYFCKIYIWPLTKRVRPARGERKNKKKRKEKEGIGRSRRAHRISFDQQVLMRVDQMEKEKERRPSGERGRSAMPRPGACLHLVGYYLPRTMIQTKKGREEKKRSAEE